MYPWIIVDITSPCKYVILHFLFYHCLLVKVSQSFYIISLILWLVFFVLIISACKNCLKFGFFFISIKLNTRFQNLLNPNMDIPTTQKILLLRLVVYAIVLYVVALFIHLFFLCQTCAVILLLLRMFETVKEYFSGDCTSGCRFVFSRIHRLCHCIYFLSLVLFS